jgi:hypothetical protein
MRIALSRCDTERSEAAVILNKMKDLRLFLLPRKVA